MKKTKKEQEEKTWLVTKSIKMCPKKLEKARLKGVIHLLAKRCRKQLDLLIAD